MKKMYKRTMSLFISLILTVSVCSNVAVFADESIFDISAYDKTELSSYTFENDMEAISKGNYAEYGTSLWGENSPFDKYWGFNIQKGSAALKTENRTATITSTSDWRMFLSFSHYDYDASENYDFSNKIMYYSFTYSGENEWNQIGFYAGDMALYWIGSNNLYDAVRIGNADGAGINASSGDSITVITDNVEKKYYFFVNDTLTKTADITNDRIIKGIIFNPASKAYISISDFSFGELTEKDTGEEKVTITVADDIKHGTVTVPKNEYDVGKTVNVTVKPQIGYILKTLQANGEDIIDNQFIAQTNTIITATFEKEPNKTIDESFYDAFNDKSNWTDIRGDWVIQSDNGSSILSQTSSANVSDMGTVLADKIYTDAVYEFDVRYDGASYNNKADNWVGISFRKNSQDTDWRDNSGYMLFWRINGEMAIGKGNAQDMTTIRSLSAPTAGEWRHLKIVNNGYDIKLFVDNNTTPVYVQTDVSEHASAGYFALNACQSAWSFDNMHIRMDGDLVRTSGYYDLTTGEGSDAEGMISIPVVLFSKAVTGVKLLASDGTLVKELRETADYTTADNQDGTISYIFSNRFLSVLEKDTYTIEFEFSDGTSSKYELLVDYDLEVADKTVLNAAIMEAKQYVEIEYTADSWKVMQDALNEAVRVRDIYFAKQNEVDEAAQNLSEAITKLVERGETVDKNGLNAAIAKADMLKESNYTALSWSRFIPALAEAKSVSISETVGQVDINMVLRNLNIAIRNLMLKPNVSSDDYTEIVRLKTNDLTEPFGIHDQRPIFSWQMHSNIVGQKQTAYQIIVSKNNDMSDIIWDSGKKNDSCSTGIYYGGSDFADSTTYTS